MNHFMMEPGEEKKDLESDGEIPLSSSQARCRSCTFDLEAPNISSPATLPNLQGAVFFASPGMTALADRLGYATGQLEFYTGPTGVTFINAIYGNLTDMIISMRALKKGMVKVVQQSLLGTILSNMLLVLGCGFFTGCIIHHQALQHFNKGAALMKDFCFMAFIAIFLPQVLQYTETEVHVGKSVLSPPRFSSCIMLVAHEGDTEDSDKEEVPHISCREAIVWIFGLSFWASILSEDPIDNIQGSYDSWNLPVAFISFIVLPLIGDGGAIYSAMKDELDNTLRAKVGSSVRKWIFSVRP